MFSTLPLFTGREKILINFRSFLLFLFLMTVFSLTVVWIIFYIFPEHVAIIEARYHIWRNHYEIKTYGYRFGDRDYIEILKEHGISHVKIADCDVNEPLKDYITHYNSIMRDAIWRDLGVRLEQ